MKKGGYESPTATKLESSPEIKEHITKEACYAGGGVLFDAADFMEINDAVVRIKTPRAFATGIYVKVLSLNQSCLLTCEHIPVTSTSSITFLYQRNKTPLELSLTSSVKLLGTDPLTYDFQLWTLSEENQNLINLRDIRPVVLRNPTTEPRKGDIIRIIQHPEGNKKRHSEKDVSFVRDYYVGYNAYTKFGSSGAAIVLRNELVGLHQEANDKENVNQGTFISKILEVIQTSLVTCPNPICELHVATYSGMCNDGQPSGDGKIMCHSCGVRHEGLFKLGKLNGLGTQSLVLEEIGRKLTYEGQFRDGEFDGSGKCVFDGGVVYEGSWKCGEPNGRGSVSFTNGRRLECVWEVEEKSGRSRCVQVGTGSICEGKWTCLVAGKVKLLYTNGGVYEGDTLNGEQTGKGKHTRPDGCVYEGDFLNDMRTGKGKFTWPDGSVYDGDYLNDMRTGKGKYTWPDGRVYEGDFLNGKSTGKGKSTWPDGHVSDVYEGDFLNDKLTGKGKLTWPDGRVYEGDFLNGKLTGKGKYTWPDGLYEGEYLDDKFHGRGKQISANGETVIGKWNHHQRDGEMLVIRNGVETKETYINGVKQTWLKRVSRWLSSDK